MKLLRLLDRAFHANPGWIGWFALMGLVMFSNAESSFAGLACASIFLTIWFADSLGRIVWWLFVRRREPKVLSPFRRLVIEALAIVVMGWFASVGGFFWLRFVPSMPSMKAYAERQIQVRDEQAHRGNVCEDAGEWVGLFRVKQWEVRPANDGRPEVLIVTAYETLTDAAGVAYVPSGGAPHGTDFGGTSYFTRLFGAWWIWRLDV